MIIGIDLGTTNSLCAYFTEEGPKIIPNRLGKALTPSVVSIDEEGQVYIGETAKERMQLYPDSSAAVFKRDMGSDRYYFLNEKRFKAEDLSALILRSLKEDAEVFLNEEITEAVISVPAYFNDDRRKATKRAGEIAGLKVERIISEPTAAAIAYGLYESRENAKFLVFDLGGGTFDVSILELFENIIEVRAVAGDNYLGGEDFTHVIENLFFEANPGIDKEKLSYKELRHIYKQAELLKRGFSDNTTSKMTVNLNDESYEFELTETKFEKSCEELLEKIKQPIRKSLSDAHIKVKDIDKVVLVGGATRLPFIRRFVGKIFRTFPDVNVNPDEAVALGAAICAAMKERQEGIKEVILTDVCPFTLGTEVVWEKEDGSFEGGHYCPIIERNTTIPASRTERLYTVHDNQGRLEIKILQGESRFAENNLRLGTIGIDIPKKKAGEEAVDVTYTYDINSILEVEAKVVSTGDKVKKLIRGGHNDMTDEEIAERMKEIAYLKIHPRDKEENKLLLLKGERLYEESLGNDRRIIEAELNKFDRALNTRDNGIIEEARNKLKDFLKEYTEEI
ncbi:MAG TPA: molecular chaperone HscC [Lachnospiraceae bacterium]|nr:molecular chaperone HscC [Lachnospiraceae bacterium]